MNSSVLHKSQYNRKQTNLGVIHVGMGAFHRAHQAYFFNKLLNLGHTDWAIAGVNLRQKDNRMKEQLQARDYRYVLKTISPDNIPEYSEIQVIQNLYNWSEDQEESIGLFALPHIKMVTITVTESGYSFNENFELDKTSKEIIADLHDNSSDCTIYKYLRLGLDRRRTTNGQPITILCCDNLRHNGKFLRRSFLAYLDLFDDKDLLSWVEGHVTFPSCMVDRITPHLTKNNAKEIENIFHIEEDSTVVAEDFIQWVIEDNFISERPPLEKVGVQFTSNVTAYEEVKIRVLNGGHTALCYFGALQGYTYFDEIIKDEHYKKFFHDIQSLEIIPALGDDAPMNLLQYKDIIEKRFNNNHIGDLISRICMDGAHKFSIYILPTIRHCFEKSITPYHAIRSIASWYIFMCRYNQNKIAFDYIDPKWIALRAYLTTDKMDHFIHSYELWGDLPQKYPEFCHVLKQEISYIEGYYHD